MLQELQIQNYAIIDHLEISFHRGLNIITGETGAGKSILMGALSLILGERADPNVVLNKEKKCFVEGVFQVGLKPSVTLFLKENDLDPSEDLVIRREINVNGKSRAFVNDTPVTLSQLQELSSRLVDLHRQFDTLSLGESGFQMAVMDAMAGNESLLGNYRTAYRQWQENNKELATLLDQKQKENRERDYHQFLFNELEESGFKPDELEELEAEMQLQQHAEGIKSALANVYEQLLGQDQPVVQLLRQLSNQLIQHAQQYPQLKDIAGRLHAAQVELDDVAGEAANMNDRIHHDPDRLQKVEERLNTGYKLLKKHGVRTTAELLEIMDDLSGKLLAGEQLDVRISELEKNQEITSAAMRRYAAELAASRKKQVLPFEKRVNGLLEQVGMPNARIKIQLETAEPDLNGTDSIDFLFDANKSNQFLPIRKVASGGELSRLMLCIKSLVAGKMDLPTLIFDEIDSGISGEASRQVSVILKNLSADRQVICITHQPQIAGKADRHLYVYKESAGRTVRTGIRQLEEQERITAIAMMLGGEKPSAAAIENAKEMIAG